MGWAGLDLVELGCIGFDRAGLGLIGLCLVGLDRILSGFGLGWVDLDGSIVPKRLGCIELDWV